MGRHKRAATAAIATALTGLGLAACGQSGGDPPHANVNAIAHAVQVMRAIPGENVTIQATVPSGEASRPISLSGRGFVDQRSQAGKLTLSLSDLPGAAGAALDNSGPLTVIYRFPTMYMQIPFLASRLPSGKSWIEMNMEGSGGSVSGLSQTGMDDPTETVDDLLGAGNVKNLGPAMIDGVPTTHYQAVVDVQRVVDRLPAAERQTVTASLRQTFGSAGSAPVQVWIDHRYHVRREQLTLSPGATTGSSHSTGEVTVDFSGFGPAQAIAAPPASEVISAGSLQ